MVKPSPSAKTPRQVIGQHCEDTVCSYLKQQGLKLLETNYNWPKHGEIDLIMQDSDETVFVEVRYRGREDFGSALESITPSKQRRIKAAAKHYLVSNDKYDKIACRFDVVAVGIDDNTHHFYWVKNAFDDSSMIN